MNQTKKGTNKCNKQTNTALPPMSERLPDQGGNLKKKKRKTQNKQMEE